MRPAAIRSIVDRPAARFVVDPFAADHSDAARRLGSFLYHHWALRRLLIARHPRPRRRFVYLLAVADPVCSMTDRSTPTGHRHPALALGRRARWHVRYVPS